MKIYTRTGDAGTTGLFGGERVPKSHLRVEAYGTLDELNSLLGWALTQVASADIRDRVALIQHDLFALGSVLATPPAEEGRRRPEVPPVPEGRVNEMEGWIDTMTGELEPLRAFILPGGAPGGAALHVARAVARRAERCVVRLGEAGETVEEGVVRYLNRLCDALFVFARLENQRAGSAEVTWQKE